MNVCLRVSDFCYFPPLSLTIIRPLTDHKSYPGTPWCRFALLMDDGRANSGGNLEVDSVFYCGSGVLAGMVLRLGSLSQNPGMVGKCVDTRALCHMGTCIDQIGNVSSLVATLNLRKVSSFWFSLFFFHFLIHIATWPLAMNSLWCNSALISCYPSLESPPAKCQIVVKFPFGR